MSRGFEVRALGEVAIRCKDRAAMTAFYRDVVGLEVIEGAYSGHITFFRIAPGHGGHTTILALFEEGAPTPGPTSSLHHLALTLDAEDQAAAEAWLTTQGVDTRWQDFPWIGWRGLFFSDPEGNTIEFVAYVGTPDASLARA